MGALSKREVYLYIAFLVDEWTHNQSLSDNPIKVTIPGPMTITDTIANTYYKSDEEMGYDLAIAINTEIKRLVDNGDAISAVANLSHDTLKERIDNCRTAIASDKKGKLAFVLLGSTILDKNTLDQMNLNMIDVKTDASELKSNYHAKVNFVIVEMQSVHPGSLDYIQSIKKITKAEKILVEDIDYYYSNTIARASKTMSECRYARAHLKKTGTEG